MRMLAATGKQEPVLKMLNAADLNLKKSSRISSAGAIVENKVWKKVDNDAGVISLEQLKT